MYLGDAQQDIYILYECSKYTGCFQRLGRAIALKRQNIGKRFSLGKFERFRVIRHVAHVFFPKVEAFQRFRNHLYFLIRCFTYHSTYFFVLCQNLSTSVGGQSIDEENHRRFARSFAPFWRKSREKEQKSFLSLFIYIYLFVLPSIITIIYNNILLIIKQSSRAVIVRRNARIATTDQNFERR